MTSIHIIETTLACVTPLECQCNPQSTTIGNEIEQYWCIRYTKVEVAIMNLKHIRDVVWSLHFLGCIPCSFPPVSSQYLNVAILGPCS
jgi:hypothetical protein